MKFVDKTYLVFFFLVALLLAESLALFLLLLFSLFLVVVVEVTEVMFEVVCCAHDGQPPEFGTVEVDARS